MPRTADHQQRRTDIADAFQRLLASEGFAGTSFVRVAAEAGISVGLIQHYFTNKQALLQFAYEDCLQRLEARAQRHVTEGEAAGRPIAVMLQAGLAELQPADRARSLEYRVQQNLLAEAITDDRLAAVASRTHQHLLSLVTTAVRNGKKCGEVATAVDHDAAGSLLLAVATGVASEVSFADDAEESAARLTGTVLAPAVRSVFTDRCRYYD